MLLATCTCSLDRCLFKSIACFSTGHCQRSLLNILDSGHHLHFQKTPLPGCGVGVFISAHSRVTDPGCVLPASSSAAGVDVGRLSRQRVPHQVVSPCQLCAQGTLHSMGCCCVLMRVGTGGILYPEPSQPWAGVATYVVEAVQCRAKGGPLPPWLGLSPGEASASLGPCRCLDLCSIWAVLPTALQQDETLAWHQQGVSAQEAPPGLPGQLPGGVLTGFAAFPWSWGLEASAHEGMASSTFPGWGRVCRAPLPGSACPWMGHLVTLLFT